MSARAFGFGAALPPVSYVGVTFATGADPDSNISLPVGSASGDYCICIAGYNQSDPTGFTLIHQSTMTLNGGQYYRTSGKVLDATDISNGYITTPGTPGSCGEVVLVYRGISGPVFSASAESSGGLSYCAAVYATTSGARGVLAFCVDRDGYATGTDISNVTKLGGAPSAGGGVYGVAVGHSLVPIANGTTISFTSLTTGNPQMATLITLK
jgi:hypothetical protein